jgi:hypothetical protein
MRASSVFFGKRNDIAANRQFPFGGVIFNKPPFRVVKNRAPGDPLVRDRRAACLVGAFAAPAGFLGTIHKPSKNPPEPFRRALLRYFAARRAMRTASLKVRPEIMRIKPIVPKSIDFTSSMDYVVKAGAQAPAALINLSGQSGRKRNLRWLQCSLKRLATKAGFLYFASWYHLLCGVTRCIYALTLSLKQSLVNSFFQKNGNSFLPAGGR